MPTEIEHIEPYSSVRSHDFENLVLLCRFHHGEVTSKRLGKAAVKEARRYPFSMRENLTTYSPELGKQVSVNFGGINVLSGLGRTFHPFSIAGIKPITISVREKLIVNLNLFDRSGSLVVSVIENVFQFRPSSLWDVKMSGTFLKVSYGLRTTILGVNISDSMIEFSTVRLSANRFPIVADKNGLFFPTNNSSIHNISFDGALVDDLTFFAIGSAEHSFLSVEPTFCGSNEEAWDTAKRFKTYKAA